MTMYFDQAAVVESADGDTMRLVAIHIGKVAVPYPSQHSHLV